MVVVDSCDDSVVGCDEGSVVATIQTQAELDTTRNRWVDRREADETT